MLKLPTVTLIIIDCVDYGRAKRAFDLCLRNCEFGQAKFLTHFEDPENKNIVAIPRITSIREYSRFMIKSLGSYFDTEHALIIQHDGFILNPHLWSPSFLEYDYVGAPWPQSLLYPNTNKEHNVGNGGFSLRSRRLYDLLEKVDTEDYHPEDVTVCQRLRPFLQKMGIRFAPPEIASQFSFENKVPGLNQTAAPFGQHGRLIVSSEGKPIDAVRSVKFDPVCYYINTHALGDALAAAPVVKWALEKYHKDCDYRVIISRAFRDFFPFVPSNKILELEDNSWKFEKGYSIRKLNDMEKHEVTPRLTPAKMSLSQYAAINLVSTLLEDREYEYPKLEKVDISGFEIDFSQCIAIVAHYRDSNRCMLPREILKLAEAVKARGLLPLFIGNAGYVDVPEGLGIDLRGKTDLKTLATIMSQVRAVCGVDNGLLHLAGTTGVTIIGGYTNVHSRHRIPKRAKGTTLTFNAEVPCFACSSQWMKDTHHFGRCYYGTDACSGTMTAARFINKLEEAGVLKCEEEAGVTTVINFSTLDLKFFDALIKEVKKFSEDIIVNAYTHFFNGEPEDVAILNQLKEGHPEVSFNILEWSGDRNSHFWHNYARWSGLQQAKAPRVLFLDADEIPEGDLMREWLKAEPLSDFHFFSCYWYFREPSHRATTKENCGLLALKSKLTWEMIFSKHERSFFREFTINPKFSCTLEGRTFLHHFSWVRTREEMLTKIKSWGHSGDRDWTKLVEKEFSGGFTGKDFVHGYSYEIIDNQFNIEVQ